MLIKHTGLSVCPAVGNNSQGHLCAGKGSDATATATVRPTPVSEEDHVLESRKSVLKSVKDNNKTIISKKSGSEWVPSLFQGFSDVRALGGHLCASPGHEVAVLPLAGGSREQGEGQAFPLGIRKRACLPQKSLSRFTFLPLTRTPHRALHGRK